MQERGRFVLIHSPLVGPSSWAPVAAELERRGARTRVPALTDSEASALPFWRQHSASAARALTELPPQEAPLLVGHSGAGPLLPAIAAAAARPVAAFIFVDAGIPRAGASRLDLLYEELPGLAAEIQGELEAGTRLPAWSDADLHTEIPDPEQRRQLLRELRPRPLAYYSEPLPVPPGWPQAPCCYLQFSRGYDGPAQQARQRGWSYRSLPGGHFQALTQPQAVAGALLALAGEVVDGVQWS